ncbi:MAG: hypothetical protein ACXQTS_06360 [Candidatus Methanospirareceae archaeon]
MAIRTILLPERKPFIGLIAFEYQRHSGFILYGASYNFDIMPLSNEAKTFLR